LVPLLIGASSRKGDLLTHTKRGNLFVDKFSTVVGIKSQDGKWKESTGTLEGNQHCLSPTVK